MSAPTRLLGAADPFAYSSSLMWDTLEHVPDLQPGPFAALAFAKMRREPRLAAILAGYTLQIRRASWQLDPAGCRDEVVQLVADDLGLPIKGNDKPGPARTKGVSWNDHLRSALMMLPYGHMDHELLAEVDDSGKARLVALAERMPHTVEMILTDPKTGDFLGITQQGSGSATTPQIPADRLAHYVHDKEGSWAGTSLFRSSWAPFFLKTELVKIHATSARRFAMGVPTVEWAPGSDPTPAQIQHAQQLASAARAGEESGASLPPGASLVLRGLSGSVVDALAFIKFLNSEMAIAALMPHMDLGTSETGSRAVASEFVDNWMLALGAIADEIADVATRQIAARIVGWNYTDEPVPRVVASGIGAEREVTAESLNLLLSSGGLAADPALEAWVRREYRLPERDPESPFEVKAPKGQMMTVPGTGGDGAPTGPAQPVPVTPAQPAAAKKVAAAGQPRARGRRSANQPTLFGDDDPGDGEPGGAPVRAAASDPHAAVLQQQWEQARDGLLKAWPKTAQPLVDELAGQAEAAVQAGDLALLGGLEASAGVVSALSAPLAESGTKLARQAAAGVVAEAADAKVAITAPADAGAERVRQTADAVAQIIAHGYASGAARISLQLAGAEPAEVKAEVERQLAELGTSQNGLVGENVGSLLSAAQFAGRLAMLEQHPAKSYRATEVNDAHECVNCREVDGREYKTLRAALTDYVGGGHYRECLGRSRCRGYPRPIF